MAAARLAACLAARATAARVRFKRVESDAGYFFYWSMIFSENRVPLFGIMLYKLAARRAGVAKLVDATDLKSVGPQGLYRFDSGRPHHYSRCPLLTPRV